MKLSRRNTHNDGANVIRTPLLGRVINAATTRIRGPALVILSPVNPVLTMAAAGSQETLQGGVGEVTLISALTNNMGVPETNTQGVQLPLTPPTQPVQRPVGEVVVPMPAAPPKGEVLAKLLAMNNDKTKEDMEGKQ